MKDVILKADGAEFYFTFLEWDTNFFNKKSYMLDVNRSVIKPSSRIAGLLDTKLANSFLSIKIDSGISPVAMSFLRGLGFRYIDTEVELVRQKNSDIVIGEHDNFKVRILKVNRGLPYKELGSSFNFTRFHRDINIAKRKADQLWIQYLKSFTPSPLHRLYVAIANDGEIMGTILVGIKGKTRIANLSFVAVRKKFRGEGVGSGIIADIAQELRKYTLVTETQIRNVEALNFYLKNGFSRIKSTRIIFHRWS